MMGVFYLFSDEASIRLDVFVSMQPAEEAGEDIGLEQHPFLCFFGLIMKDDPCIPCIFHKLQGKTA